MFDNPAADAYACVDWGKTESDANKMLVEKTIEIGKPAVKGAVKGAVVGGIYKGPDSAIAGAAVGTVGGIYDV